MADPGRAFLGAALHVVALAATAAGGVAEPQPRPRLHLVTFMNRVDRHFAYLQVSAQAHELNPVIVGYGVDAWWPDGLGTKINALRHFVQSRVEDRDLVVFADAFDVLVFGSEGEIVSRFEVLEQRANKSVIFNAEEYCFPQLEGVCDAETYPVARHRWRFLNSGLIMARGQALKELLHDPVPDMIKGSDQFWYQKQFKQQLASKKNAAGSIHLDTECFLLCAVAGVAEDHGVKVEEEGGQGRLFIPETNSRPPLVHFVSTAHWPRWRGLEPSSTLHDIFRQFYPEQAARLLDSWHVEAHLGTTHTVGLYEGKGSWRLMRLTLCLQCRLLGSKERECEEFPSLMHDRCGPARLLLLILLVMPALCILIMPGRAGAALRSSCAGLVQRAVAAGRPRTVKVFDAHSL